VHYILKLEIDENAGRGFMNRLGQDTNHLPYIFDSDIPTTGEVSMVTPWITEPGQ
jgi:hypothetical protein